MQIVTNPLDGGVFSQPIKLTIWTMCLKLKLIDDCMMGHNKKTTICFI